MTEFLQLCFAGLAVGSRYALVALGFVIIFKATGVINFAQGALLALGAYFTYTFASQVGLPFFAAVGLALVASAVVGILIEAIILRRMVGQPPFAVLMVTIGLLFILQQVITSRWGFDTLNLGDPWGLRGVRVGGVAMSAKDLWTIGLTVVVVAIFFAFFRLSRLGVAMRATAFDQEAALAQGISARRVFAASWAIAAALAALAGITVSAGPAGLSPAIEQIALLAFPAMIVGGLDSPFGAVIGGLIIGLAQVLTAGYQPDIAPWLGSGFSQVMPYVVMILILLVRPYGLFGTPEVRRI